DCGAAAPSPKSNVVIHVIADQTTVDGAGSTPGVVPGVEGLIPAELLARLADFVRCRDLTCRAPGCDRPAVFCDLDHTVAYADGGRTHASNLKCLCRKHHLLKT